MAGVRDPAFWRRFSVAVHLDEEKVGGASDNGPASPKATLKHSDTWLEKSRKKKRRTRIYGCTIALVSVLVIVGGVFALMYFLKFGLWSTEPRRTDHDPGYSEIQAVNPIGT